MGKNILSKAKKQSHRCGRCGSRRSARTLLHPATSRSHPSRSYLPVRPPPNRPPQPSHFTPAPTPLHPRFSVLPTHCPSIPSPYQLLPKSYHSRRWVGVGKVLVGRNQVVGRYVLHAGNGRPEKGEHKGGGGRIRGDGRRATAAGSGRRRADAIPVAAADGEPAGMRTSDSVRLLESANKKNIIDIVFFLLSLHRKPKTINNQKIRLCQNFFFWAMRQ